MVRIRAPVKTNWVRLIRGAAEALDLRAYKSRCDRRWYVVSPDGNVLQSDVCGMGNREAVGWLQAGGRVIDAKNGAALADGMVFVFDHAEGRVVPVPVRVFEARRVADVRLAVRVRKWLEEVRAGPGRGSRAPPTAGGGGGFGYWDLGYNLIQALGGLSPDTRLLGGLKATLGPPGWRSRSAGKDEQLLQWLVVHLPQSMGVLSHLFHVRYNGRPVKQASRGREKPNRMRRFLEGAIQAYQDGKPIPTDRQDRAEGG